MTYAIDKVKVLAQDIDREAKICSEARLRKMDEDAQRNAQKQDRALEILEAYHKLLLSNPDLNPHTRQPFAARMLYAFLKKIQRLTLCHSKPRCPDRYPS